MAVPKKRTSRTRRDKRRSHDALKPINLVECENCGAMTKPHRVCPECGYYKGRIVKAVEE
ncbi:50S ribosomal protein L32 [bacterium]|nr:50S ribosomal protein L32 [bacterium]